MLPEGTRINDTMVTLPSMEMIKEDILPSDSIDDCTEEIVVIDDDEAVANDHKALSVIVDDEIPPSKKLRKENDEFFKANFDIAKAIETLLDNLRFQAQVEKGLKGQLERMNVLETNCKEIDDLYDGMEKDFKGLLDNEEPEKEEELDFYDTFSKLPIYGAPESKIIIPRAPSTSPQVSKGLMQLSSPNSFTINSHKIATSTIHQMFTSSQGTLLSVISSSGGQSKHPIAISPAQVTSTVNGIRTPDGSNEVIPVGKFALQRPNLPPMGAVKRKPLTIGMKVYALKGNHLGVWYKCRIIDIRILAEGEKQYRVKLESKKTNSSQKVYYSGKHLAYIDPPDVILPVGSRIIAYYRDEHWSLQAALYAGIIAEPPKVMNSYRYLVFFDDGYAQYVKHSEVHLVCEASNEVWEDIHPDSKQFIRNYLQQYPERPMVKLQKGQIVKTEWNGSWWIARVMEVDASLVKMFFDADKRTEWIYRGSTRLAPLYNELANAEANRLSGKSRRHTLMPLNRKKHPYVEYTRGLDEPITRPAALPNTQSVVVQELSTKISKEEEEKLQSQVARKHTIGLLNGNVFHRNVARKSTTQKHPSTNLSDQCTPSGEEHAGTREILKKTIGPRFKYVVHTCCQRCIRNKPDDPASVKGKSPLRIPMLLGWERQIAKHRTTGKRVVFYRAPCGRRLRSIEDVNRYLIETKSKLTVDLFCFDSYVHTFTTFLPHRVLVCISDITYGKENVPVSCVNTLDTSSPSFVEYSTERFTAEGVPLNLDPEFLCGCDCKDNCQNRDECACQQLTIKATEVLPSGKIPDAGYKFRRLHEPLVTGIYECNKWCKCNSSCLNRVAQNGLHTRLQLFKTEKRGWGIRCVDDIPQGMFICIYAGQLLNEQTANKEGHEFGDEYLAELDHVDVMERIKEGYESDVVDPDDDSEKNDSGNDSDDESTSTEESSTKRTVYSTDSDYDAEIKEDFLPRNWETRSRRKLERQESVKSESSNSSQKEVSREEQHQKSDKQTVEWLIKNIPSPDRSEDSSSQLSFSSKQEKKKQKDKSKHSSARSRSESPVTEQNSNKGKSSRPQTVRKANNKSDKDSRSDSDDSMKTENGTQHPKSTTFGSLSDPKKPCSLDNKPEEDEKKFLSLRTYYNEEHCYIMDAKTCGNIGRYLNHSCSPNVFVQNVFVDTHDLRFPWVAFFAMTYIRAGTELTWDYNYDVGSVPGKVMYCYCGSSECRGRLL
ncbi:histone-lysine N-methyltransferase SETDB1-like isoform X1 [Limulus polyphemus]|uniref:Histone-lysine N-methyltransferase SETDB1-like isoform X1 n=2 Tax=Limulus polyphemus TaxID=6850 RepID=A0ABM1B3F7_LIMPO|nr:histone-lysine N-methyltransferase SETDB1-like isoform X1 [Limulus polyphemus]